MTTPNPTPSANYTALVAYIVSVVPEIMELKAGCRFEWNNDVWKVNCSRCEDGIVFAFSCSGDAHDFGAAATSGNLWRYKFDSFDVEKMKDAKILGRPITLADVLLACNKTIGNGSIGIRFDNARFVIFHNAGWNYPDTDGDFPKWDRRKPLSGQDKDVEKFLASILPISK